VADKEEEVLYDRAGAFGSLGFEHVSEVPQRHYGVLLIGSERLLAGQGTKKVRYPVGSCYAPPPYLAQPRRSKLPSLCGISSTFRAPGDFIDLRVEGGTWPAFVQDADWLKFNVRPETHDLRTFVGGGGYGAGNEAFANVVQATYSSSSVDEFRRPAQLRERLRANDGPVFSATLRCALAELYRALPTRFAALVARLDDPYNAQLISTRACSEREAPLTVAQWHGFVHRCFALAAVYRACWASAADVGLLRTAHVCEVDEAAEDKAERQLMAEMEQARVKERPRDQRLRRADLRRAEREASKLPPLPDCLFWSRPKDQMNADQAKAQAKLDRKQERELGKAKREENEAKRLAKYKKRLAKA